MICKEEYATKPSSTETGERQIRLPCNDKHTVGADCIVQWLQSHTTCPVCRYEFFPAEKNRAERSEPSLIDFIDEEDVGGGEEDDGDEEFVADGEETDEEDVNMSDGDECVTDEESEWAEDDEE